MVERNAPGLSTSLSSFLAFLLPSSASRLTLFSLREITAISDAAKKALREIRLIIEDLWVRLSRLFTPLIDSALLNQGFFPTQKGHAKPPHRMAMSPKICL